MPNGTTIADWTEGDLARFIDGRKRVQTSSLPASQVLQNVEATQKLLVSGDLQLSPQALAYLSGQIKSLTYRKTTPKVVNTSTTATDLLNSEITVAANVLGTNGRLRLTAFGDYLQNAGVSTNTWRFQLKFGATTLFDTGAVAQALGSNATRWPWKIIVEIQNTATGTQVAHISLDINFGGTSSGSTATFVTGEGRYGVQSTNGTQFGGSAYNTSSVDTTVDNPLVLNVINPNASALCETKLTAALIEII